MLTRITVEIEHQAGDDTAVEDLVDAIHTTIASSIDAGLWSGSFVRVLDDEDEIESWKGG